MDRQEASERRRRQAQASPASLLSQRLSETHTLRDLVYKEGRHLSRENRSDGNPSATTPPGSPA